MFLWRLGDFFYYGETFEVSQTSKVFCGSVVNDELSVFKLSAVVRLSPHLV